MLVITIGGAFFLLTANDDDSGSSDETTATTAFDPDEPFDQTDPAAVVTRFEQATWAGGCDTAAAMVTGPMWRAAGQTPRESCENREDEHVLIREHLSVEVGYNDGDYATVTSAYDETEDLDRDPDVVEAVTTSFDSGYILVRDGDSWLVALEAAPEQIDLESSGLEYYFGDDPPLPGP